MRNIVSVYIFRIKSADPLTHIVSLSQQKCLLILSRLLRLISSLKSALQKFYDQYYHMSHLVVQNVNGPHIRLSVDFIRFSIC